MVVEAHGKRRNARELRDELRAVETSFAFPDEVKVVGTPEPSAVDGGVGDGFVIEDGFHDDAPERREILDDLDSASGVRVKPTFGSPDSDVAEEIVSLETERPSVGSQDFDEGNLDGGSGLGSD